jgi:hypothetical protein
VAVVVGPIGRVPIDVDHRGAETVRETTLAIRSAVRNDRARGVRLAEGRVDRKVAVLHQTATLTEVVREKVAHHAVGVSSRPILDGFAVGRSILNTSDAVAEDLPAHAAGFRQRVTVWEVAHSLRGTRVPL